MTLKQTCTSKSNFTIINLRPHHTLTTGSAIHPHKKRHDKSKTHPHSATDRRHAQPAPNTHPASHRKQQKGKSTHRPSSRPYQRAHRPIRPSIHQPPHTNRRLARKPYMPSHTPARDTTHIQPDNDEINSDNPYEPWKNITKLTKTVTTSIKRILPYTRHPTRQRQNQLRQPIRTMEKHYKTHQNSHNLHQRNTRDII